MSDNKITQDQLEPNVIEELESGIGNLNALNTENKDSLVAAVTEIYGKSVIAEAVGEPLAATDTFVEMGSEINGLISQFKTNMMNAGVVVESGDKFKALIEKIKGLTEGEGNKGIQFAEGSLPDTGMQAGDKSLCELDLGFTPTIMILTVDSIYASDFDTNLSNYVFFNLIDSPSTYKHSFQVNSTFTYTVYFEYVDNEIFMHMTKSTGYYTMIYRGMKYYAIGVGEEDTTLRDSLASILEEEGVEVTEEDTMASLIVKTDEEFTENTNKLYNLMLNGGYEVNESMNMDKLLEMLELSGIEYSEIKQIACGNLNTFVLKKDGRLYCSGTNKYGELGLGDTDNRRTFTQVTTNINNDVKQVACGWYNTFIIKNDGSLWSCGYNSSGVLGLGDTTKRTTFTQVTTNINNDVKQVACRNDNVFIIKNNGSLWACGMNDNGQLGLGDEDNRNTFTQVTTNINNDVKEVICGGSNNYSEFVFIIKNDGSLWACGRNDYKQLGLGDDSDTNTTTFTQVTTNINNDVKQVACGNAHTFIVKNDGTLWACGYNNKGQFGLGNKTNQTTFTQVTTNINNDVKQVSCGNGFTFIVKNDGSLWSCGMNDNGQLGIGKTGETYNKTTFTQVTTNINNDVKHVSCGWYYTLLLKNDDSLWGCGEDDSGVVLGMENSSTTYVNSFRLVPSRL